VEVPCRKFRLEGGLEVDYPGMSAHCSEDYHETLTMVQMSQVA